LPKPSKNHDASSKASPCWGMFPFVTARALAATRFSLVTNFRFYRAPWQAAL
jgi:hypothetical protein